MHGEGRKSFPIFVFVLLFLLVIPAKVGFFNNQRLVIQ